MCIYFVLLLYVGIDSLCSYSLTVSWLFYGPLNAFHYVSLELERNSETGDQPQSNSLFGPIEKRRSSGTAVDQTLGIFTLKSQLV